jgi:hypothetical protein
MSERPVLYFAGGCVLLVALMLAVLGLIFLVGSQGKAVNAATGVVMLVLGLAAGGLAVWKLGQAMAATPDRLDERVLNLAAMSSGDITVGEAAGALSIPVAEAEASLARLVGRNLATLRTRPDGQAAYVFAGLTDVRKVKKCPYCGGEYSLRDPKHTCPTCGANLEIVDAS